jgi:hypothetical protein
VSDYLTFSLEVVTSTAPQFNTIIPPVTLAYNAASLLIPMSYYFSAPNGETLTMSAKYALGANSPTNIPWGIFT